MSLEWTVNVVNAGNYFVDFAYANGSTGDRPMELRVNNVVVDRAVSFGSTGSFANWEINTSTVSLAAGVNTIELTANTVQGSNFDYLELVEIPTAI